MSLDETSYDAGDAAMGDHPIAWYHEHDGGRAFYTALGHVQEAWDDEQVLAHLEGAIAWAGSEEQSPSADATMSVSPRSVMP
jgi:type 1 glutamine amidotransferase